MDLISEVSEELAYYIYAEKKACLPGLGCFEAVYESALLDPSTDTLLAPTETIRFGLATEEDNIFVDYLTKQLDNKEVYEDFKQKVVEMIMYDAQVALPGLGLFIANKSGEIRFENEQVDEFNFDFDSIVLKPIPSVQNPAEHIASNAPRATTESAKKSEQGMSFLRIGMLAVVLALCLALIFQEDTTEEDHAISLVDDQPVSKLLVNNVNSKINVSPKDNQNEVYIAAKSSSAMLEVLKEDERAEIVDRQAAMSVDPPVEAPQIETEIITNTFSSRDNVDRQIELIESFGYQSAELEKESGLIATMIILTYADEEALAPLLEQIKQDFPRAKVNN